MLGASHRLPAAALCLCAAAACSAVPYAPRELDMDAAAREYAARRADLPGLAQFAASQGYDKPWPPGEWRLEELTLVALYFGPEVRTARAQAQVARAGIATAGLPTAQPSVTPGVEHHSREPGDDGPWSVGVAIGLPWVAQARREARLERAVAVSESTDLEVARAVWRTRAQVRDRLIDLIESGERLALLERALSARRDMRALVARRVEAGMLSARELSQEEAALAEIESALVAQRGRMREAGAALALSLGLSLEIFAAMTIAADPLLEATGAPAADRLRHAALRNRLDIHQRLLAFGAADAEVRLAVASQYPELTFSPGYFWDQGDNVWSLAASVAYPRGQRVRAAVREAEARREVAALRVIELQSQVIGDAQLAAERLASADALAAAALAQAEGARARLARVESLFERGAADRLELTAARLGAASSARIEREAAIARLRALAALEDATQQPFLDPGQGLRAVAGARQ
jgi:outer membrane protein TolC